jgi:hypothetical protein
MEVSKYPKLTHSLSEPNLAMEVAAESPRTCERCKKVSLLSFYRLGHSSIVLHICGECVSHYRLKERLKGVPLSSRDFTPRPKA